MLRTPVGASLRGVAAAEGEGGVEVRPRLEAVLFAFGGLFTASPFGAAEALGAELGAPPGRLLELLFGPYHADTDHPWHRLQRGEIALAGGREAALARRRGAGIEADPIRVFQRMAGGGGVRQAMVERVRRLRGAGLRTALVTNNAREFRDRWRALIPADELFEHVIDSSEVGVRKPDLAIFRIALARLGDPPPERVLFLDDYEGDVLAARSPGPRPPLAGGGAP